MSATSVASKTYFLHHSQDTRKIGGVLQYKPVLWSTSNAKSSDYPQATTNTDSTTSECAVNWQGASKHSPCCGGIPPTSLCWLGQQLNKANGARHAGQLCGCAVASGRRTSFACRKAAQNRRRHSRFCKSTPQRQQRQHSITKAQALSSRARQHRKMSRTAPCSCL